MGMIDVGEKQETQRIAIAQALVFTDSNLIEIIKDGNSPKGNIFEEAKISETIGVKKTFELIPYCHLIPIDGIKVDFAVEQNFIKILVTVNSVWKTGVEMEALTGASIAALTIYDMLKPMNKLLSIESIKILKKQGGMKDFYEKNSTRKNLKAVVIVVSDTRTIDQDESGKIIVNTLSKKGFEIYGYKVLPDELKIIEKELNGVVENLRGYGQQRTPLSMLSRSIAGIRGKTIIINLPGSSNAVSQSLSALFPGIMHAFKMIKGQGH